MAIRYQPFRLKYNESHPITSKTFESEEVAAKYAIDYGLTEKEINVREVHYTGDEWMVGEQAWSNRED